MVNQAFDDNVVINSESQLSHNQHITPKQHLPSNARAGNNSMVRTHVKPQAKSPQPLKLTTEMDMSRQSPA